MKFLKFGTSKNFIVFLHGWAADKSSFLWLKNNFENFSLVFVDFPGFGESGEPDKPFFVADYAKCLKDLLDEFSIESLVLVGHSFGGRVAIKFLSLYQKEYQKTKLCLVDSAGIKPRRTIKYYYKVFIYKLLKKRAEKNPRYKECLFNFGSSDYRVLSPVMKQTFIHVVNEDLSKQAKQIVAETIIVWGSKDDETKLYMAKKLHKLIKNSELYVLKNAGHFSFLDKPVEFVYILDTFVKKQ